MTTKQPQDSRSYTYVGKTKDGKPSYVVFTKEYIWPEQLAVDREHQMDKTTFLRVWKKWLSVQGYAPSGYDG